MWKITIATIPMVMTLSEKASENLLCRSSHRITVIIFMATAVMQNDIQKYAQSDFNYVEPSKELDDLS